MEVTQLVRRSLEIVAQVPLRDTHSWKGNMTCSRADVGELPTLLPLGMASDALTLAPPLVAAARFGSLKRLDFARPMQHTALNQPSLYTRSVNEPTQTANAVIFPSTYLDAAHRRMSALHEARISSGPYRISDHTRPLSAITRCYISPRGPLGDPSRTRPRASP